MRLSVYTACLPTLNPEEGAAEIARLGFAGIEWRADDAAPGLSAQPPSFFGNNLCTIPQDERGVMMGADIARRTGLDVVGLGCYVEVGDVAGGREATRLAEVSGAPTVRFRAPRVGAGSYASLYELTRGYVATLLPDIRKSGARLVFETHHGTICSSASLTHRLVEHFDPAEVGVIYDLGNMILEGYEDHSVGFGLLGPYVSHVHLKNAMPIRSDDGKWSWAWSPLDDGFVDLRRVLAELAGYGFDGWVSLEDFSSDRTPLETLEHNASVLKNWGLM